MKKANEDIDAIVNMKDKRTFSNTMEPLSKMEANMQHSSSAISFYSQVSTDKNIREAAKGFAKRFGVLSTDLWMREDLYRSVKGFDTEARKNGEYEQLDSASRRYLNHTL